MHVNVAGTVNVFEAVSKRLDRIPNVTYASSAAVYNPTDPSPAPNLAAPGPETLYGVSKLADEGMARVVHDELGVPSIGLRPVRRLRPRPRSGNDVRPYRRDARGPARRAVPHRLLRHGAVRLRTRRGARARHCGAFRHGRAAAVYNVPGAIAAGGRTGGADPGRPPGRRDHLRAVRHCRFRRCSRRSASTATSARSHGRPWPTGSRRRSRTSGRRRAHEGSSRIRGAAVSTSTFPTTARR